MTRSRCLLHLSRLDAFAAWAEARGYRREPPKGDYEVLRLARVVPEAGKGPLVYYARIVGRTRPEHATAHGDGLDLVHKWLREATPQGRDDHEVSRKIRRRIGRRVGRSVP